MSEPFIAEVRIFAGNFAPRGWAFCNGQTLPIDQNTALFSLIGTIYGGDGRTTTALPDLQGRSPMHPGRGPGLSARRLGETGGTEETTLTAAQIPAHTHELRAGTSPATAFSPSTTTGLARSVGGAGYGASPDVSLAAAAVTSAGGAQPHNNRQPYLALNFIIALAGLYPSRS